MSSIQVIQRQSGIRYKAILKQGSRALKSRTFKSRRLAKQWLDRMHADRAHIEALGLRGAGMTLSMLIDQYLLQWEEESTKLFLKNLLND